MICLEKNQGCEIFTGPPGLLKIHDSKAQLLLQTTKRFPYYSTGSLCGEYTRYQWNPLTKCSDTWYRLFYDSKYAGSQSFETPWHPFHCNGYPTLKVIRALARSYTVFWMISSDQTIHIWYNYSCRLSMPTLCLLMACHRYMLGICRNSLTHWGRVTHICVSTLDHNWFRYWLVACSAPSHYLNQCCHILN